MPARKIEGKRYVSSCQKTKNLFFVFFSLTKKSSSSFRNGTVPVLALHPTCYTISKLPQMLALSGLTVWIQPWWPNGRNTTFWYKLYATMKNSQKVTRAQLNYCYFISQIYRVIIFLTRYRINCSSEMSFLGVWFCSLSSNSLSSDRRSVTVSDLWLSLFL